MADGARAPQVLAARLGAPPPRPGLVARPRLVEHLQIGLRLLLQGLAALGVVSAPGR